MSALLSEVLDPGSVLACSSSTLVCLLLTSDESLGNTLFGIENNRWLISVEIVPVEVFSKSLDGVPNWITLSRTRVISEIVEVVNTVVVLEELEILSRNQVEVEHGLWEAWRHIDVPVSGTVSNHEAFEVDLRFSRGVIVHVDLPGEVWNVDATIALSRNVKRVRQSLWETIKPIEKGDHCILGLLKIVGCPIFRCLGK
jgi:hypothetical protein